MATLNRTLSCVMVVLLGCGPPTGVQEPTGDGPVPPLPPPPNDAESSGVGPLPQGKLAASFIPTPPGVLVTRVDQDQLQIVYASGGPFSAAARFEKAMESSQTAFRKEPMGAHPANFHDLFDGLREPDPFLVVASQGDTHVGKMYPADESILEDVQELMAQIEASPADVGTFCQQWEELIQRDPKMPVLHEQLAGCYQAQGEMNKAIEAIEAELEVNPTHPAALLGVAAALAGPSNVDQTRHMVTKALLYYPAFKQARQWVNETGALADTTARTESFSPRISITVDDEGWVLVRAPENQPWLSDYATCKAGFRYAPEVRLAFGMKAGAYKPSLLEEMVCLRIAADGYADGVASDLPREVMGELMVQAVQEKRLLEAAFFEVIGYHDPDMMKLIPPELQEAILAWIEDTVLIEKQD